MTERPRQRPDPPARFHSVAGNRSGAAHGSRSRTEEGGRVILPRRCRTQHHLTRPLQIQARFGQEGEILDARAPSKGLKHGRAMWQYARGRSDATVPAVDGSVPDCRSGPWAGAAGMFLFRAVGFVRDLTRAGIAAALTGARLPRRALPGGAGIAASRILATRRSDPAAAGRGVNDRKDVLLRANPSKEGGAEPRG